jgi:hypothetical protein
MNKEDPWLNDDVCRRRLRMLRLLARGTAPSIVVEALAKEFNCSAATVCHDYARLNVWAYVLSQDDESTIILGSVLDRGKVEALRVTVERIGLFQELGLLEGERSKIKEKLPMSTPFESDPVLREALLDCIAKQKAEKVVRDAAKGSDATRR